MSNLTSKPLLLAAIVLGSMLAADASAAIALDRTRVVFDGSQKSISLSVNNRNDKLPYLAQGWIEDADGKKVKEPLMVLPPIQRIEAGKSSQLRIQALPDVAKLPKDRESLFYFNLREIPPKSSKPNTLQLALQTRIKLFYRPASLEIAPNAEPVQNQLTLTRQGNKYSVNNPTGYYITLINAASHKDAQNNTSFRPLMVAPKSSAMLSVTADGLGGSPVLTYINDYGGRPDINFSCSTGHCKVVDK